MAKLIRSPITVILGHVDSGKTSLLDKVRGTAVQAREAGGITQTIGATLFPRKTIFALAGKLLPEDAKKKIKIPGILIIDTPGHAAFSNLRVRGSSIANFAILVIDVRRGIQPQTVESIRILKQRKVPFFVALNKIDRLPGWKPQYGKSFTESFQKQSETAKNALQEKIYELMGGLAKFGFDCDRFDKIKDYRKKVAIIPTSALTGEGIPEMFLVLMGIAQQYLQDRLELHPDAPAKGTVLEVKKEQGMGTTLDVIIYDGIIRKGDKFITAGINGPIISNIKNVLLPKPLDEIRDPRNRFDAVDHVVAAAGVKIVGNNLDDALAGAPFYVIPQNDEAMAQQLYEEVEKEIKKILIETDQAGIIVKADSLGTLEALTKFLRENQIPIAKARIGDISKRDILDASINKEHDEKFGAILAFRVKTLPEAADLAHKYKIVIFTKDIIYELLEEYEAFVTKLEQQQADEEFLKLVRPAKIKMLPYIFRVSNPAIVGIEVVAGTLKPRVNLINENNQRIGHVLQIQHQGENIQEARVGMQVAISVKGAVAGRKLKEDHIYYVDVPESHARKYLEEFQDKLSPTELEALNELIDIKRKLEKKFWAL